MSNSETNNMDKFRDGIVTKFIRKGKYGFIQQIYPLGVNKSYFFHCSAIKNSECKNPYLVLGENIQFFSDDSVREGQKLPEITEIITKTKYFCDYFEMAKNLNRQSLEKFLLDSRGASETNDNDTVFVEKNEKELEPEPESKKE